MCSCFVSCRVVSCRVVSCRVVVYQQVVSFVRCTYRASSRRRSSLWAGYVDGICRFPRDDIDRRNMSG